MEQAEGGSGRTGRREPLRKVMGHRDPGRARKLVSGWAGQERGEREQGKGDGTRGCVV